MRFNSVDSLGIIDQSLDFGINENGLMARIDALRNSNAYPIVNIWHCFVLQAKTVICLLAVPGVYDGAATQPRCTLLSTAQYGMMLGSLVWRPQLRLNRESV